MKKPATPPSAYFKEIAWAVFMINLIVALCALLLRPHIGTVAAGWVFAGFAALVTSVIGGIVLANVILVWLYGWWERWMNHDTDRKLR